jgi:hypothetical protein
MLRRREDLDELMQLFPRVAIDRFATLSQRFQALFECADMARKYRHPSVAAAHKNAMWFMEYYVSCSPTLELQYLSLLDIREIYQKLPFDYASYQVRTGQINNAIETLEQGRALRWSEMRGFRTSAHQFHAVDSALAEKFVKINRNLEKMTTSAEIDGSKFEATHPYGHLLVKRRKLWPEHDQVISQIRAILINHCNLNIVRSRFVRAEFALLSACHTAELLGQCGRWRIEMDKI